MSCANISGATCAGGGAFAVGAGFTAALLIACSSSIATATLLGTVTGACFAATVLTARAADEIFKKMGWEDFPVARMLASHTFVAIAIATTTAILIQSAVIGILGATALAAASFSINLLANELTNK